MFYEIVKMKTFFKRVGFVDYLKELEGWNNDPKREYRVSLDWNLEATTELPKYSDSKIRLPTLIIDVDLLTHS